MRERENDINFKVGLHSLCQWNRELLTTRTDGEPIGRGVPAGGDHVGDRVRWGRETPSWESRGLVD